MMHTSREELKELYWHQDKTLQEIGDSFGVSRERVRQVMERYGVKRKKAYGPYDAFGKRGEFGFKITDYQKYYSNKRDRAFESINDQDTAYWVGYLLADGTVADGQIILQPTDKYFTIAFKHFIGCNLPIREALANTGWEVKNLTWNFRVVCGKMVDDLKKYGVIRGKTHNKKIKNIPDEYLSHYLRGFFDGDGCVCVHRHKKHPTWQPTIAMTVSSNLEMCEQIQDVLIRFCGVNKTKLFQNKIYQKTYRISYTSKQAMTILKWLYNDAHYALPRKQRIYNEYMDNYRRLDK
jgi:intein/homing endonuclease